MWALAPLIAGHWLQSKHLSQQTLEHAVALMGLVAACRWPIALYQGALIGAQRLAVSSGVSIVMVTMGNLGAVAVLAFVSPTIEAFFIWQACAGLVYAATMRWTAWRIVGRLDGIRFDVEKLKTIVRFSAGMGGIALSGLVFTQLDKIVLSKILSLEDFGHYMLATVVVSGLYVLVMPIFNVVYPRLSALVVAGDTVKLTTTYRMGTRMLGAVLFPIAMLLAVFSQDLLSVWTGNIGTALIVAPILSLLVIGSALNGIMFFPYALQLAYGMTWIPLAINIVLMCFLIPLVIFLAQEYGALGGAMAWLTSQLVYVMLGPWLTHRYLLKGLASKWLLQDVGLPLILSVLAGFVGMYVTQKTGYSVYVELILGAGLALFASVLTVCLSPSLRSVVLHYMGCIKYTVKL